MEEVSRSGIIITVFSTASAVGKTLLSVNMGAELAKNGYRVCVVDLDLQYGDVCHHLQLEPQKTIFDAQAAIEKDAAAFAVEDYVTVYEGEGPEFAVVAAPLKMEEACNVSTLAVTAVLSRLRPLYDYVILDTTAAFSELNLAVMDFSTIITFVGIVDFIPTIKNMKIGYDTMRSIGYEKNKIRFVLNRSNSKTHIELQDVEQLLEEPFYHVLPNDFAAASRSLRCGVPLVIDNEGTRLSASLQELVGKYTNRLSGDGSGQPGVTSWVKRLFK